MGSFSRAGRDSPGRRRDWLRAPLAFVVAAVAAALLALSSGGLTGAASASSGGTGVPNPSPPKTTPGPLSASNGPLTGRGMWVWYVSASSGGNLASIIATARTYGLSALMIKAGDGVSAWSQFNRRLVAALHAAGLKACAWQYVYGNHPLIEASVGAAAVRAGADCLLIDAESEYEGRYVQAQQYIQKLRRLIGSRFPVALAGFPFVDYHPGFPYSVFLGPGGAQYNVPQMYWSDIGTSVDNVYAHTYEFNAPYERPIEPLGEVAGNPPAGQVLRFRQISRSYGATGVSWWDWQQSSRRSWQALGRPVGNLSGFEPQTSLPLLTPKGQGGIWAGDLVVWAQEHLVTAGEQLQVDGAFGPQTQAAVEQFQTTRGLPVTGLVDLATWQSLLTYPPVTVTWVKQRGKTVAVASRAAARLAVPWSAHLHARRYEIPRDLGAGRSPH